MTDPWWAPFAWAQLWQVTLTAAAIWLIVRICARHRPRLAYLLWMLVVVKCLTPPVWSSSIGLFSQWMEHSSLAVAVPIAEEGQLKSSAAAWHPDAVEPSQSATAMAEAVLGDVSADRHSPLVMGSAPSTADRPVTQLSDRLAESSTPAEVATTDHVPDRLYLMLAAIWLGGVVIVLCRILWKWHRLQRTLQREAFPAKIQGHVQSLAKKLALRRVPRLAMSSLATVPAIFGCWRPTLVLPERLLAADAELDLEPILAHELIHVKRRDTMAGQIQLVSQALWWFHPLVWWTNAEIRRERERCCDETVIALMDYEPLRYANSLVSMAEHACRGKPAWLQPEIAAVGSFAQLTDRLEHVLQHARSFRRQTPLAYSLLTLLLALCVLPGRPGVDFSSILRASAVDETNSDAPTFRLLRDIDLNGDGRVDQQEFFSLKGPPGVLSRDFRMFDLNGDESLSAEEYAAVPLGRTAAERGELPDPVQEFVSSTLTQWDDLFLDEKKNPTRQVEVAAFVSRFLERFPEPNYLSSAAEFFQGQADLNKDRLVSQDEARRFLEIQYGIRLETDKLLRFANGQVVRWGDVSGNDFIPANRAADQIDDPIEQFRAMDADLNALLDAEELRSGSPEDMQELASFSLPAFDVDGDGKLSLQEYRLTLPANSILPWKNRRPVDRSRDDVIQFLEFTSKRAEFPLLQLYYFQRFDLNGNGALEPEEYQFHQGKPDGLYRINADGTDWTLIYRSEQYCILGSPRISPDGKWIVCETFEKGGEGDWREKQILLMTIDGKLVRSLGRGILPNWSPDGRKFVFTHPGIQVLDLSLNRRTMLAPNGWGGQWSPDGRRIAFTDGPDLKTIDPVTKEITTVLGGDKNPYLQIFWNTSWSPDGTRLCIQGRRRDNSLEVATINMDGNPTIRRLWQGNGDLVTNHAWSPDGKRLVFPWRANGAATILLHELDPDQPQNLKPFPGVDPTDHTLHSSWSPDGQFLIVRTIAPE